MTWALEALTSRLEGVRRSSPTKFVAKCPAHKDRRASLSIRELDQGRIVLHCFAGCAALEVLDAIGLDFAALFPPRSPSNSGAPPERRPFSVRDLVAATSSELTVAWVILADVAAGRDLSAADRKRAGVAAARCAALIEELHLAG